MLGRAGRARMALAALLSLLVAGPAAAQPAPLEINVVLPLSGPAALLGQSMLKSIEVAEKRVNATGGIGGRPVKFVMNDDTSNPQVGVQIVTGLQQKRVPLFIGSAFLAVCSSMAAIVAKNGPVQFCLAPVLHPQPRSFVFTSGPSTYDFTQVMARYFRERGWKRVAMITSTDASGTDMDAEFSAAMERPQNASLQLVARERFAVGDLNVSAQLARIKSAAPDVILSWTVGTPFGTVLRGMRDAGIEVPMIGATGNLVTAVLQQLKDTLPPKLEFVGFRAMVENDTRPGPIREAQAPFYRAYREAGIKPDIPAVVSWDTIMIVVDAFRKLGPNATARQIQAYFERLHGYPGINSIYDFRDGLQRGTGGNALQMQRWDPSKNEYLATSRAGGSLR